MISEDRIPVYSGDMAVILNKIAVTASDFTFNYTYYREGDPSPKTGEITVVWNEQIGDSHLQEYFKWFTNEGNMLAASGSSLEYMLTNLYRLLKDFHSTDTRQVKHSMGGVSYDALMTPDPTDYLTYAYLYDNLANQIVTTMEGMTSDLDIAEDGSVTFKEAGHHNYPGNYDLPPGSAVMRWAPSGFVPVYAGLDGVASLTSYCYPPALYYYVNSTLSTVEDENVRLDYTENKSDWEGILSCYQNGSKSVQSKTKSVALDEPMQFANGMLIATVKASANSLPDKDGQMVALSASSFPVTGVIIGEQYPQRYDFTPISDENTRGYFLYDNQISGVYLTKDESNEFRTLVLQTPAEDDVYFCLELRNDSEVSFTGAEGRVLPGHYFYLTGKLSLPENPALDAVFLRDHASVAHCLVNSLAVAHNAVPDLGSPQFALGIQTQVNWVFSTGTTVVLY